MSEQFWSEGRNITECVAIGRSMLLEENDCAVSGAFVRNYARIIDQFDIDTMGRRIKELEAQVESLESTLAFTIESVKNELERHSQEMRKMLQNHRPLSVPEHVDLGPPSSNTDTTETNAGTES